MIRYILVTSLFCSLVPGSGRAIPETGPQPVRAQIQVMVLGTFHFEGASESNDVLAAEQQTEIRAVVDSLARFRPTKVALEAEPADSARLDSLYRAYAAGDHELTANERQQIGYRLATRLNHQRIWTIDHKVPWPNRKAVRWAKEHQPGFIDYYRKWRGDRRAVQDSLMREAAVGDILRRLNSSEYLRGLEELRMRKLELGAGSSYPGTAPVLSMYERDLKIFANLTRIAEPGDRILVIYGTGHVSHLRTFVRNHPGMKLVDPLDYL